MRLIIICLLVMSNTLANSSQSDNLSDLLPKEPSGWKIQGEDKIYDSESLYDYINGGAELYISYGMKDVVSRLITHSNGDEIRIEIFDMMNASNAFGVFSHTRTTDEGRYGQGSQYFPGTLIFWKDRYYVSIMATDENENIKSAINDLAAIIDAKISEVGQLPEILNLLPEENLERDGFMYFHHYIWLNSYYYIADDNFLGIDAGTNAVLAKYGDKESRQYLLIIEYPDPTKTKSAFNEFKSKFLNPDTEDTAVEIEDGKWLGGTVQGRYFICVFNAGSKTGVEALIEMTRNNTQP